MGSDGSDEPPAAVVQNMKTRFWRAAARPPLAALRDQTRARTLTDPLLRSGRGSVRVRRVAGAVSRFHSVDVRGLPQGRGIVVRGHVCSDRSQRREVGAAGPDASLDVEIRFVVRVVLPFEVDKGVVGLPAGSAASTQTRGPPRRQRKYCIVSLLSSRMPKQALRCEAPHRKSSHVTNF